MYTTANTMRQFLKIYYESFYSQRLHIIVFSHCETIIFSLENDKRLRKRLVIKHTAFNCVLSETSKLRVYFLNSLN